MKRKQIRCALRSVLTVFASLGLATSAHADVLIQPTGVLNTNGGNLNNRDISKTIDGSGMFDPDGNPVAAITTANLNNVLAEIAGVAPNNSYWISSNLGSANFSTVVLTFDLGESFDGVDRVHLWSYSATNGVQRGFNTVEISFSSDNITFGPTTTLSFSHPPTNTRFGVETVSFDAVSDVRYIRFTNITNHGDNSYLAFSEIRFGATTNPSDGVFPFTIRPNEATAGSYDFEWSSQPGKVYDLLTSTDLADPISEWPVFDDGVTVYEAIPTAGETTTLTAVPSADPRRFFAMRETDAPPPPPLFELNFEEDDGGFTASTEEGTSWAWGTPDSSSPGGSVDAGNDADPGTGRAWGTNLGAYDDGAGDPGFYANPTVNSRLISPDIDLTEVAAAELHFAQAIDVDPDDSAVVRIYDAATGDEIVGGDFPLTVTDPNLTEAPWEASGPHALPVGSTIRIEWILNGTGGALQDYMGWYIDDVAVTETTP